MSDADEFPYVQSILPEALWHHRLAGDEWTFSLTGPNARTACGLAVHSVHVARDLSAFPDEPICAGCAARR